MALDPARAEELAQRGDAAAVHTWDHEIAQTLWDSDRDPQVAPR